MSEAVLGQIEAAGAALEAGDRVAALDALLAAWRECRAPAIEAVIDTVSGDIARALEPLDDTDPGTYDEVWGDLERRRQPADIPHLIGGLWTPPKGSISLRVRALLARGPDPRIGAGLVRMISEPPMTSSSNFSTWTTLFAALPEHVDDRAAAALKKRAATKGGKSQFWPKLTGWIEAALPTLPAPASVSKKAAAALEPVGARAAALAAGPAPTIELAVATNTGGVDPDKALGIAATHLDAGELAEAIEALRSFWAARRTPEIAELVDQIGMILDDDQASLEVGSNAQIHKAWMKRGENPTAAEVGVHLDALRAGKLTDVEERLSVMSRWVPDPRVSTVMFRFTEDYMLGGRPLLWRALYELLLHHADPRVEERFRDRIARIDGPNILERYAVEATALRRVRDRVLEAYEAATPLYRDEKPLVAKMVKRVAALTAERDAEDAADDATIAGLVDAIVEDPQSDGPRAVFSDWLLERSEPLGTFIALSIALANGKRVRGKLTKFQRANEAAIRGPLDPLVYRVKYDRGLMQKLYLELGKGVLNRSEPELAEIMDDWRWSTLEHLRSWSNEGMERVLARAPLRLLQRLEDIALAEFSQLGRELPHLEWLALEGGYSDINWADVNRAAKRVPALRRLHVMSMQVPPLELFTSELVANLESLSVATRGTGGVPRIDQWIDRLYEADCRIPRVVIQPADVRAIIASEPKRKRFKLGLTFYSPWFGNDAWDELLAMLAAIGRRPIADCTISYDLPSRDKRRRYLREAVAHLKPTSVRLVPREPDEVNERW